jgi:hypothetical protein
VLPHIWFRNTWIWRANDARPQLRLTQDGLLTEHADLDVHYVYAADSQDESPCWLLTENETNVGRLYGVDAIGPFKDAFHEFLIDRKPNALASTGRGTKAAAHFRFDVAGESSAQVRLRLSRHPRTRPFADFEARFAARLQETDDFYADIQRDLACEDARLVQRQAFAGMIWSKQFFYFDIPEWLSFAMIDPEFAKQQLVLLTREWYMHPNGQMPAYEWAFGDVNPPVHAWATWRVYQMDRKARGGGSDLAFLERVFHKLLLNFTWWVNRKDAAGRNVFQGGFLGLDNIGVFDRSAELPTGGHIDQADGTAWMAMYALNLMRIALELAQHNPVYEDIATKLFEHFLQIAGAMNNLGEAGVGMWDEEDRFFYDVLRLPRGGVMPLKLRSMLGLTPLFAVETTLEPELLEKVPNFKRWLQWYLRYLPELAALVSHWNLKGRGHRRLLTLLRGHRMKRLFSRMLDETEFLSDFGVSAISKFHEQHPYKFRLNGTELAVSYLPGESDSGVFGGNSNWRGPIWFPVNYLLIESMQKFHHYYGDEFKIECPTGSGQLVSTDAAARDIVRRLTRLFLEDRDGLRPVLSQYPALQKDPHLRDYVLFSEYFHGGTGRGAGASHQTGWTGLIAKLLQPRP